MLSVRTNIFLKACLTGAAILPLVLFNRQSWGQSRADLETAKAIVQRLGLSSSLDDDGRHDDGQAQDGICRTVVDNAEVAFANGLELADPRPTPLQNGALIFLAVGSGGNVVFFLDSQDMLKNARNLATPVHINKKKLLTPGVELRYGPVEPTLRIWPDLTFGSITLQAVNKSAESVQFEIFGFINNVGLGEAGSFNTKVDFIPGLQDYYHHVTSIHLSAGSRDTFLVKPGWFLLGLEVTIQFVIDDKYEVTENNETNNTKTITFKTRELAEKSTLRF